MRFSALNRHWQRAIIAAFESRIQSGLMTMPNSLLCYRCGASLASLSLPFSRYDECPSCANYLRVCRMCAFYDPHVPKKCTEDDAEEIPQKERLNFCEWFVPGENVFDGKAATEEARAKNSLAALFGAAESPETDKDDLLQDAENLFK
jgi:hypothetical protein